jgi:hypothetical protein
MWYDDSIKGNKSQHKRRNHMENKERLLTIKEAAGLIEGLSEYRIRQLCISGELKCFKAGRKYLFTEKNLKSAVFGEVA